MSRNARRQRSSNEPANQDTENEKQRGGEHDQPVRGGGPLLLPYRMW